MVYKSKGNQKLITLSLGLGLKLYWKKPLKKKADSIIVHHGYFWKGEAYEIIGIKYQGIATLIKHVINFFAYHLPLDTHPQLGNNVMPAQNLECKIIGKFDTNRQRSYGLLWQSSLILLAALKQNIYRKLRRKSLAVGPNKKVIQKSLFALAAPKILLRRLFVLELYIYI